jgi:hypothetical protein
MSGTFAIDWLAPYRTQLTPDQEAVVERALAPDASRVTIQPQSADAAVPAKFVPAAPAEQEYLDALAQARLVIAAKLGRPLTVPYSLTVNATHQDPNAGALAYAEALVNPIRGLVECAIHAEPELGALNNIDILRASMAHEMFHCFQDELLDEHDLATADHPAWLVEGEAEWAGEATFQATDVGLGWWETYLGSPGKVLFGRTYDAVGFYEHMAEEGIDPWTHMDAMLVAATSIDAYKAAEASRDQFLDTWGSGLFRDQSLGPPWYAVGRWATTAAGPAEKVLVKADDIVSADANPATESLLRVTSNADIVETRIPGHARLHGGAIDDIGLEQRFLCTRPDNCPCPAATHYEGPDLEPVGPTFAVALTGGLDGIQGLLWGHSLDEYCTPTASPPPGGGAAPPCIRIGCGSSNGDPHLRTVNGLRYDFQAAGEYVLLRSPDGSIEIQDRMVPVPGRPGVSFNAAVAARVNGHRVGVYGSSTGLELHVDGAVVAPGAASLGPGASVAAYGKGYELTFPDGSELWALGVDILNVVVRPSDQLRGNGRGLLAEVHGHGMRVPVLPDGAQLPAPADSHQSYQLLYGQFGPAWQVTPQTSLFDYGPGQSVASFQVPGYPAEADLRPVSPATVAQAPPAGTGCAAVTDPDLRADCAFDVAATSTTAYADLYTITDQFEQQGPAALAGQTAPPTTPASTTSGAPTPAAGSPAAGVHHVADGLLALGGLGIGPDDLLYTSAVDLNNAGLLLVIDPRTGDVLHRIQGKGAGQVAFAAGSIWIGNFERAGSPRAITRLDLRTLAEEATVAVGCSPAGPPIFAGFGDAIWFIDPTGADAAGNGGHLRRIDATTNSIDRSIELPPLNAFATVRATQVALFYGNPDGGAYRLLPDADHLDPVGPQFSFSFPVGDGVWAGQPDGSGQGSVAGFYTSAGDPERTVAIEDGQLVAASAQALYVKVVDDTSTLVRYALDGSAPEVVATEATIPTAGGTTRLLYQVGVPSPPDLWSPLLVGDHFLVATWLVPAATESGQMQLIIQTIPEP